MCGNTQYIQFDTNLNLFKKKKNYSILPLEYSYLVYPFASVLMLILLSEHESDFIHFLIAMSPNPEFLFYSKLIFHLSSKVKTTISMMLFVISVILIFSSATTQNSQYLCLCVLQICFSFVKQCLLGYRPY